MRSLIPPLLVVTLLVSSFTSSPGFASGWEESLQNCLESARCAASPTPKETKQCCVECIATIDFGDQSQIGAYINRKAPLLCSADTPIEGSPSQTPNRIEGLSSSDDTARSEETSSGIKPLEGEYRFTLLFGGWWESHHIQSDCNRDEMLANVIVDIFETEDHTLFGRSHDGVLKFTPLSRCPGTMYGGLFTSSGPTFRITGRSDELGYHIRVMSRDWTDFFYTSGEIYISGDLLNESGLLTSTRGVDVTGILPSFTIPRTQTEGSGEFRFETPKSPSDVLWWTGGLTLFLYHKKEYTDP